MLVTSRVISLLRVVLPLGMTLCAFCLTQILVFCLNRAFAGYRRPPVAICGVLVVLGCCQTFPLLTQLSC